MVTASAGAFTGQGVGSISPPMLGVLITIPEPLINSARGIALHNRISKQAIRVVLMDHHVRVLPEHFRQTARSKYDHRERSKIWKRQKRRRYGSITDLVASGRTRDFMLATFPKVRVKGQSERLIEAYVRYKFPFPVSRDVDDPRKVTINQMALEIASWTNQEMQDAVNLYRDTWVDLWEKEMAKAPKWREKLGPNWKLRI